jgi:hypothetical protein
VYRLESTKAKGRIWEHGKCFRLSHPRILCDSIVGHFELNRHGGLEDQNVRCQPVRGAARPEGNQTRVGVRFCGFREGRLGFEVTWV